MPEPKHIPEQTMPNFGSLKVRPPQTAPGLRIGILGGTFNPPHIGHRNISVMALKTLHLDYVWWLVTPGNPIKSHSDLATLNERITAAENISNHPRIKVTGFEASLPTNYTADTLAFLKKRFNNVEFVWLMGADNLVNFHKWQKWRNIFKTMPIAVFDRPGYHLKALSSPAAQAYKSSRLTPPYNRNFSSQKPPAWQFITLPLSYHSSTELRNNKHR